MFERLLYRKGVTLCSRLYYIVSCRQDEVSKNQSLAYRLMPSFRKFRKVQETAGLLQVLWEVQMCRHDLERLLFFGHQQTLVAVAM